MCCSKPFTMCPTSLLGLLPHPSHPLCSNTGHLLLLLNTLVLSGLWVQARASPPASTSLAVSVRPLATRRPGRETCLHSSSTCLCCKAPRPRGGRRCFLCWEWECYRRQLRTYCMSVLCLQLCLLEPVRGGHSAQGYHRSHCCPFSGPHTPLVARLFPALISAAGAKQIGGERICCGHPLDMPRVSPGCTLAPLFLLCNIPALHYTSTSSVGMLAKASFPSRPTVRLLLSHGRSWEHAARLLPF